MAATGPSSPQTTKETPDTTDSKTAENAANSDVASQCAMASSTATASSSSASSATMPTYLSTKQSKAYTLSKQLLSSGSLDDALTTLEMALQLSREMLANSLSAANSDNKENDDDLNIELHESLAPLYYLYGTTLLYAVEESDVMMANGKQQQGGVVEDVEVPSDENEADEPQNEAGDDDGDHENEEEPSAVDTTEDLQIAWENLDLARSIVSRLVDTFHNINNINDSSKTTNGSIVLKSNTQTNETYTSTQQTSLLLDLAQIHTRLGDLQRANANVLPCIDDYNLALKLRLSCLGGFDRKVADSHFSLAAVYAEAPNSVDENEGRVDSFVSSLGAAAATGDGATAGESEKQELSEEEKVEFRHLSLEHYLACGVAFAGLMAKMCGEDAETLTNVENCSGSVSAAMASSAAAATLSTNSSNHHSKTMATLRQRLSSLPPPKSQADKNEFNDLKEMLDEIQEAIDTAEETEEGLRSLGEMKANEIKKHEMKTNGGDDNEDTSKLLGEGGITTTIGFGAPSSSFGGTGTNTSLSSVNVNAFGSTMSSAASATAMGAAPTMMIVKKKKKKPQSSEEESPKRLKTN